MPYVDLNTIHNPATGTVAPASWGDQVRDNDEFLIDPPACSVFNSGNQSIGNGTVTALTADSENFDNNAMHSTVSNTSRITAQTAGRYLLVANVSFAANSSGVREVRFLVNGTTTLNGILYPPAGGTTWRGNVTKVVVFSVSDYVECMCQQNSGGALDANLVEFAAYFLTR